MSTLEQMSQECRNTMHFLLRYLNRNRNEQRWHAESKHLSCYPDTVTIRKHQLHAIDLITKNCLSCPTAIILMAGFSAL